MRLVSCHIENFGTLSNQDISFSEGLHTICENNGYGKSTLTAFLRVMLYGFQGEKKRDDMENERKRYMPWQGGVYGGRLTFEADGVEYEVSRTFQSKSADDTFELRETATNMPSKKFSEKLGEELFQIDQESFVRTVFITQNQLNTKSNATIDAKIGNLSENTDDLNNYETAITQISNMMNQLTPSRKTGLGKQLAEEMSELQAMTMKQDAAEQEVNSISAEFSATRAEQEKLREKQREYQAKAKVLAAKADQKGKRGLYKKLVSDLAEANASLAMKKKAFPGEIPSDEVCDELLRDISELGLKKKLEAEKPFVAADQREYEDLKQQFVTGVPTEVQVEDKINAWNEYEALDKKLVTEQTKLEMLRKPPVEEKKANSGVAVIAIGALVAIVGILVAVAVHLIAGISVAAAGVIIAIIGLVLGGKTKPEAMENPETSIIERGIENIKTEMLSKKTAVVTFLSNYGKKTEEHQILNQLYNLKAECKTYVELSNRKTQADKSQDEIENLSKKIEKTITAYGYSMSDATESKIHEIKSAKAALVHEENLVSKLTKECDSMKAELGDILDEKDSSEEESETMEALADKQAAIDEEINLLATKQEQLMRRLETAEENYDDVIKAGERLVECKAEHKEVVAKFKHLELTAEYLKQAKESFTAAYMAPIKNAFMNYYEMIASDDKRVYRFDANANLSVEEAGHQRDPRFFSEGYQNLYGLCMRMALVDVMYKDEKPFVIIDDPFVNLDDSKIPGAMEFLAKLSEKYQVIYTTCHESLVV